MVKKILFISLALFGLLFFEMAEVCFADASAQLEQADAYMKDKNYEQAEAIYQQIVTDYPGTEYAFKAQKNLTFLYIAMDQQSEAEAALQKLLTDFSEHQYLPHAVHKIAEQCCKLEKGDTVRQLYQNVLDNQPQSEQAIWLQMGVAISNNYLGDETATKAAIEKLIAEFSGDKRSAEAVSQIAWSYRKLKKYERAKQLYQYVVDNWAYKERAIFSQRGVALCNIALGDETAAWAAIEKLLAQFSQDEHITEVISRIASAYRRLGKYEKAEAIYQQIVTDFPDSKDALEAQKQLTILYIKQDNQPQADAALQKLLTNFSEHKRIAEAVNKVADRYTMLKRYEKARELYQYVVDHWPDDEYAMRSEMEAAKTNVLSLIKSGDDPNAQMALDNLIVDFNSHSDLPAALYKIARKYEQQGKYEQARSTYLRIIQQAPASPEAGKTQLNVAKIDILSLIAAGDDPNAQAALDRLIADFNDHPGLPRAIVDIEEHCYKKILAAESYVTDNYLKPVKVWEKVMKKFPDFFHNDPDLYYFIADCYRQLGEYEKAVEYYGIVATNWTQNGYAVLSSVVVPRAEDDDAAGDYEALHETIDRLIVDFNDHPGLAGVITRSGHGYRRRANDARRQGLTSEAAADNFKAIVLYDRVINEFASSPFTASAYFFSALSYRDLGQRQSALDCCKHLLDNWPEYKYAPWARKLAQDCSGRLASQVQ